MSQPRPDFFDSSYFVADRGDWQLKRGAPKELKREFAGYMKH
ncbi:MAG: hypothetical protein H6Q65_213 [Firmicutes bacterium]|nr:hypothetical protein [Bacillota bacterium]